MISDLFQKTTSLVAEMSAMSDEVMSAPVFTRRAVYREWLGAAYADPDFLFTGDFVSEYTGCRGKEPEAMSMDEIRACVTFYLRQMRCEYPPYSCLCDHSLLRCLSRWIDLIKKTGYEKSRV